MGIQPLGNRETSILESHDSVLIADGPPLSHLIYQYLLRPTARITEAAEVGGRRCLTWKNGLARPRGYSRFPVCPILWDCSEAFFGLMTGQSRV